MLTKIVYPLLAAFRFLTIIPVSWKADQDGEYLASSLYFFPIVGLVIGLITGSAGVFLLKVLPLSMVSVLLVILLAFVSGCLHIDGLADSCDGLFSSRSRQRMLEIMRDSRTGVMGVVGIVSLFFLKISALNALDGALFFPVLVLMPLAGRVSILVMMAVLDYVRGNEGIGSTFFTSNLQIVKRAVMVAILLFAGCLFFSPTRVVLSTVVATVLVIFIFSWYCRKMLGGFTGDTLGAICELTETAVAVSAVVTLPNF